MAYVTSDLAGSLCLNWRQSGDSVGGTQSRGLQVDDLPNLLVTVACVWAGGICWCWELG